MPGIDRNNLVVRISNAFAFKILRHYGLTGGERWGVRKRGGEKRGGEKRGGEKTGGEKTGGKRGGGRRSGCGRGVVS